MEQLTDYLALQEKETRFLTCAKTLGLTPEALLSKVKRWFDAEEVEYAAIDPQPEIETINPALAESINDAANVVQDLEHTFEEFGDLEEFLGFYEALENNKTLRAIFTKKYHLRNLNEVAGRIEKLKEKQKICEVLQKQAKQEARQVYAQNLFSGIKAHREDYLLFDLEANESTSAIIDIGVMDFNGKTLMNTYVYSPVVDNAITRLTGIKQYQLSNAPHIETIMAEFKAISCGKTMLSWGNTFDRFLLEEAVYTTGEVLGCDFMNIQDLYDTVHKNPRSTGLANVIKSTVQSHRALSDCQLILKILAQDKYLKAVLA